MAQPTYVLYPGTQELKAENVIPVAVRDYQGPVLTVDHRIQVQQHVLVAEQAQQHTTQYEMVPQSVINPSGPADGTGGGHAVRTDLHPEPSTDDFEPITLHGALFRYGSYHHTAHVMLYSRGRRPASLNYPHKKQTAKILMQLREDGRLGFPGGHVEPEVDTSIVAGLNREVREEINIKRKHQIPQTDYISSNVSHGSRHVLHWYAHELSEVDFSETLRRAMESVKAELEIAGVIQVPLHLEADGYGGFPVFLSNMFSGNTRAQLIQAIVERQLMQPQQLSELLNKANQAKRML